jgi:hypothetical protein
MLARCLLVAWLTFFPITWTWRWHWQIVAKAKRTWWTRCGSRQVLTWCRDERARLAYAQGYMAGLVDRCASPYPMLPYRALAKAWCAGWWDAHSLLTNGGLAWYQRLSYPQPGAGYPQADAP